MDPETLIVALRKNAVLVVMHVVLGTIIGAVANLLLKGFQFLAGRM